MITRSAIKHLVLAIVATVHPAFAQDIATKDATSFLSDFYKLPTSNVTCGDHIGVGKLLSEKARTIYNKSCNPHTPARDIPLDDPRFADAPDANASQRHTSQLKIRKGQRTEITQGVFAKQCSIFTASYFDRTYRIYGRSDFCLINENGRIVIDKIIFESRTSEGKNEPDFNPQLMRIFPFE